MATPDVFGIVLAGGEGKRLAPLTLDRAKPAVPFGGNYRLIDFALSNLVNAGFRRIVVLTQYKSHSLDRHIAHDVAAVAAARQLRDAGAGADAPRAVLVLRLGRRDLPEPQPAQRRAARSTSPCSAPTTSTGWTRARWSTSTSRPAPAVTVAALRAPLAQADQFGVIETGADGHTISAFREKPKDAVGLAGRARPGVRVDGQLPVHDRRADRGGDDRRRAPTSSSHDMGGNIVPMLVGSGAAHVYDFSQQRRAGGERARPRLLARRRDARRVLRRAHGPRLGRPGVQPLQQRVADPDAGTSRCRRRSSCSTRTAAAATRSTRWCAPAW